MKLWAAADIGNSKTDLIILDAEGRVHGWWRAGRIAPHQLGPALSAAALEKLVAKAGLPPLPLWVGAAGVDFPDQEAEFEQHLLGDTQWSKVTVRNDIHALAHCVDDGAGPRVAVVLGAGTNAVGIDGDREVRFSALGRFSGDHGGGLAVGMDAVVAASRGADGRGPRTVLEELVPDHFGLPSVEALSRALDSGVLKDTRLLELAPLVCDAARQGDAAAIAIIDLQAVEVAAFVQASARRLHVPVSDCQLVLGGSLLRHAADLFQPALRRHLGRSVELLFPDLPPVAGAAAAALAQDGLRLSAVEVGAQLTQCEPARVD